MTSSVPKRKPIAHGTPKGYKQHRYRGEQACVECLEAHRRYKRDHARKSAAAFWAKQGGAQ